jgi:hypothetical protein
MTYTKSNNNLCISEDSYLSRFHKKSYVTFAKVMSSNYILFACFDNTIGILNINTGEQWFMLYATGTYKYKIDILDKTRFFVSDVYGIAIYNISQYNGLKFYYNNHILRNKKIDYFTIYKNHLIAGCNNKSLFICD